MPTYRIYFLRNGAQIEKGIDVDCRTDEAAVEHAERLARCQGQAQVWCGCRSLGTFPGLLDSASRPQVAEPERRAGHARARSGRSDRLDATGFIDDATDTRCIPPGSPPRRAVPVRSCG